MDKLTPTSQLLLFKLTYKRDYFQKRHMLADDGSFYYSDKKLSEEIGRSIRTIGRSISQLVRFDLIKVKRGRWKLDVTRYWIVGKLENGSPVKSSVKVDILSTFDCIVKTDKILAETDKSDSKACQNVALNKVNNNEINNLEASQIIEIRNFTDEQKEGIRATLSFWNEKKTKEFFMDKNYNEAELDEVLGIC